MLLQILYGNLAPEGCVAKITGKEGLVFEGPAKVYDSEEDMLAALSENPAALKVPSSSHMAQNCQDILQGGIEEHRCDIAEHAYVYDIGHSLAV